MATLPAFERNRYFFGKLMDVGQFRKEQDYFRSRQAILNRLVLGSGIVDGLDVVADPDTPGRVIVGPGLAIDPEGRMIVVPAPVSLDPAQLTDAQGVPQGDPITEGTVAIQLGYAEICADPVPVFINDCDTPSECTASTIREVFLLVVSRASEAQPGSLVPLGQVSLVGLAISTAGRSLIATNRKWQQARVLRYVSGDGQTAPAGRAIAKPLVVQVLDATSQPVGGVAVRFQPTTGSVTTAVATTNAQGIAQAKWTLGTTPGEQHLMAASAGTSWTVDFHAKAL
jgi:hypothetical protein